MDKKENAINAYFSCLKEEAKGSDFIYYLLVSALKYHEAGGAHHDK